MTVEPGGAVKVRSIVASLAAALLLVAGCRQDEDSTSKSSPNPVPRADLGQPVEPKRAGNDAGGVGKEVSKVEKDLRKDLGGGPVIKPNVPQPTVPHASKSDTAKAGPP